MLSQQTPEMLSVSELAQRLQEETVRFLQQGNCTCYDDRPGLALFRIAFTLEYDADRANAAWAALYTQYEPLIRAWITQRSGGNDQPHAALINAVFARFFQAVSKERKIEQFPTVGAILRYLKCCANSVIADAQRGQHDQFQNQHEEEQLNAFVQEPSVGDLADGVIENLMANTFWREIRDLVIDDREYLLLVLTYQKNLKPRQIWAHYPESFPSLEEVYRIKRNVLERLRRRPQIFSSYTAA